MKQSKIPTEKVNGYKDNEGNIAIGAIVSDDKGHAQGGWEIVNGNNSSEEGNYYGFTIVEAPMTMTIEGLSNKFKLNGSVIPSTTNVATYFPTLSYQPCIFTKLTIDSGTVIVYKK